MTKSADTEKFMKSVPEASMFVIPCTKSIYAWNDDTDDVKYNVQFYLTGKVSKKIHPLNFQSLWLEFGRGFAIPPEAWTSLTKLRDIAIDNNVHFDDLCRYALNYPDDGGGKMSEMPLKQEKMLTYDSRIETEEFAEELNLLAQMIIDKKDLQSLAAQRMMAGWLANLALDNGFDNLLCSLYLATTSSDDLRDIWDNMTYDSAKKLDCYYPLYNHLLVDLIQANFFINHTSFGPGKKIVIAALENFADKKVAAMKFKILNIKKMQAVLGKVLEK